jgi:hypothetical protein
MQLRAWEGKLEKLDITKIRYNKISIKIVILVVLIGEQNNLLFTCIALGTVFVVPNTKNVIFCVF